MKRSIRPCLLVAAGLLAAGCNTLAGQPRITAAGITPAAVRGGESAVISVTVKDKNLTVTKIEGTVKEDSRLRFALRDDGQDPDAKAGDGTWSLRVNVPEQAPPGQFTVELTAYNDQGLPVLVRDGDGAVGPLSQAFAVTIEAPVQQ